MRTNSVIYPGTFDPITNGHVDLTERAARLFDRVVVAIAHSEKKTPLFNLDERVALCADALSGIPNVEVKGFSNLLTDFAISENARCVLRGLRAVADFEYEYQMVGMNRAMDNTIETVFLMAEAQHQAIASKLVKEIARLGGDVSKFVTPAVNTALIERLGK